MSWSGLGVDILMKTGMPDEETEAMMERCRPLYKAISCFLYEKYKSEDETRNKHIYEMVFKGIKLPFDKIMKTIYDIEYPSGVGSAILTNL